MHGELLHVAGNAKICEIRHRSRSLVACTRAARRTGASFVARIALVTTYSPASFAVVTYGRDDAQTRFNDAN